MKEITLTKSQEIILNNLPYGKENAISKKQLIELTHMSERKVRLDIAFLRKNCNVTICSSSNTGGYYFPASYEEANQFANETVNRIRELAKVARKARKWANKNRNQVQMVVE